MPEYTDPCASCGQDLCEPGEYEERHTYGDCLGQVQESVNGLWYHSYCSFDEAQEAKQEVSA